MRFSIFAFALSALPAMAEDFTLDGQRFTLSEVDYEQVLSYQGKVLYQDSVLQLGPLEIVEGGEVAVLFSGAGGNACAAPPLVLSLKNGEPLIHGPLDACDEVFILSTEDEIIFETKPGASYAGKRWFWHRAKGFTEPEEVQFTDQLMGQWDDIATWQMLHPVDALRNESVYAKTREVLGSDYTAFASALDGIGSGQMKDQGYSGQACAKWECDDIFAHLWIDPAREDVYLIWKNGAEDQIHSVPKALDDWPQWAAQEAAGLLSQ